MYDDNLIGRSADNLKSPKEWARQYHVWGLTAIPICLDTKIAAIKWGDAKEKAEPQNFADNFTKPFAIGILCGKSSGGLEVIDFDDPTCFRPFMREAVKSFPPVLRCPIVKTPSSGFHIYYRTANLCDETQLATKPNPLDAKKSSVRIELRRHGHLVVAPGGANSEGRRVINGTLSVIPILTDSDRATLLDIARSLHIGRPIERHKHIEPKPTFDRAAFFAKYGWLPPLKPWEEFCERTTWEQILEPLHWRLVSDDGQKQAWRHPHTRNDVSATTNHYGNDRLHVFTTSVLPLEQGRSYSKWQAWALLHHDGDFAKATKLYNQQLKEEEGDHAL